MSRSRQPLRRSARRGFTLLELMVSLTVGGIAITSIYAVGAASTRVFHQQQQIATLQSSLRIALGQVKRDIGRAGFLSTPSVSAGQACIDPGPPLNAPNGNGALAAISRFDPNLCSTSGSGCQNLSGSTGAYDTQAANIASGFTGDSIVMMGNYETASEYADATLDTTTNDRIKVEETWHAFRNDFTRWHAAAPDTFDLDAFKAAFPVGRLIRLRTTRDLYHFATVLSVTAPAGTDGPTITFAPRVPISCNKDMNPGWVAPISTIRYFPRNEVNPPAANADSFGPMAQLVRQEVDPTDKLVPLKDGPPARVVLDYLVAFNLAFVMNDPGLSTGQADNFVPGVTTVNLGLSPERVRAVRVLLAARTPEQDEKFPWDATTCARLRCFQVFAKRPGAARVRTVHAEVFLPNVAFEGY